MKKLIFSAVFLYGLLCTPVRSEGLWALCSVAGCGPGTECRLTDNDGTPGALCVPNDQIQRVTPEFPACYGDRILFNVPAEGSEIYTVMECDTGTNDCPGGSVCTGSAGGKGVCCRGAETTPGACPAVPEGAIGVCGGVGLGCIADTECPTDRKCCSSACGSTLCTTPVPDCDGGCAEDEECVKKQVQCVQAPCTPVYECVAKDNGGGCPKNQVCNQVEAECDSPPCEPAYECQNRCGGCQDDEICVNDTPRRCRSSDCESFVCKPDNCKGKCTGEGSLCSIRKANTCKTCSKACGGKKCAFKGRYCFRSTCIKAVQTCVRPNVDVVCSKECREFQRCILVPKRCRRSSSRCRPRLVPKCVNIWFL